MIDAELRDMLLDIKSEITLMRNELLLLGHDIAMIRERLEENSTPTQSYQHDPQPMGQQLHIEKL